MTWLLAISVLFNILLALVIAGLIYTKATADNDVLRAKEQWRKWEERWYDLKRKLMDGHNLSISIKGGAYGTMIIKDIKEQ